MQDLHLETPLLKYLSSMQGLAHCFEKDDNGKLADCFVIEPISANSLEVCTLSIYRLCDLPECIH